VSIVEKDINGDVIPVWSYPELDQEMENLVMLRTNLKQNTIPLKFAFSKYKNDWIYVFININEGSKRVLPKVAAFSLNIIATDYNPEKYSALCQQMSLIYSEEGEPVKIVGCFLSVFAKGVYSGGEKYGSFSSAEFDPRKAYLSTSIRDIVKMFGEDAILLWTAIIMKKKIAVYSPKLGTLLKVIRGLPLFAWHRQSWGILRPYMSLTNTEIQDLKTAAVYCAGFTDDSIREKEELYDIFVDISNHNISVAAHAKDEFMMTKVHEDIKDFLTSKSEDPEANDQDVIKGLALKTKELLDKLATLKTDHEDGSSYIEFATLQNTRLPPNMDRFLYAVAVAEGMAKI